MTKQQISKKGRLGRHFTQTQREIIKNAREMVQQNTGMTVEEAMRRALVFDAKALEPQVQSVEVGVDLAALKTAFGESLRQEVTAPLVEELKALRGEVEALRQDRQLESPKVEPEPQQEHGLLVRIAMKIERFLHLR
jgi:hypothetical protein